MPVLDPLGIGFETRIIKPFPFAHQLAEIHPELLIGDGDGDGAVLGMEYLIRNDRFVGRPPARCLFSGNQVIAGDVGKTGHLHVEQADIQILAPPGSFPPQ